AEQLREHRIAPLRSRADLVPGALLRVLVRAEAEEASAVPDALVLHLVVTDLTDQLGPDLVPRQILSLGPTGPRVGRATPFAPVEAEGSFFLQRRQHLLQLLLKRPRDP